MADHLPECPAPDHALSQKWEKTYCTCDRLRAAEQRVRDDEYDGRVHTAHNGRRIDYYNEGYADALRDAVDVVWKVPAKARHEDDGLISLLFDKGEIVAAIDGLSNPNETNRASDSHQPQIDGTEAHDER